ncbi:TIGR03757 family integrating conjugative element protein [Pectobacterium aroidearum]|uniref:TIGR03757 family integrating conjugative element protein n=1 Tax=Pectobacterium zantedeschiae TaxID=2034769 RepID=A0A9X8P413_9GAMM|nr:MULTISPECIES: TIGR03757 family integrating conjugative element protein [Pectobacterium]MCA6943770.1 TIGR03757 family integrating conjugative element protein [Pectobacterium polaris]MCA6959315.1 TIGR03757 family integrating conjugative element protein [Pectobacterium polaris]RYC41433.1 TIGR03757 family integrating conjugative element protein [Pectobacterium zantedeschiae]RYC46745.1 TIGR03757 family integrating conjugative element protein [Pectobacterium zantedeschiae]
MLSPAITSPLWRHTIAAGFLIVLLASPAQATEVLAVTDTRHPMQNLGNTRLIELDRPSLIEAELAANLPQDPARAAIIVQQRLREGGTALQQRINEAYQDVVDAWSLGITTLPAVIVDQRYVVYGEPDIARAVELINTHRRTQP